VEREDWSIFKTYMSIQKPTFEYEEYKWRLTEHTTMCWLPLTTMRKLKLSNARYIFEFSFVSLNLHSIISTELGIELEIEFGIEVGRIYHRKFNK